jgi:hypothetical protein
MRDAAKPALPRRNAQIKMTARMMNDMKIPKETRLVADAMKPVIDKIVDKK